MATKNVLILATNYGTWGEELQAPADIIKKAGHRVTLATPLGKKPLPLADSEHALSRPVTGGVSTSLSAVVASLRI